MSPPLSALRIPGRGERHFSLRAHGPQDSWTFAGRWEPSASLGKMGKAHPRTRNSGPSPTPKVPPKQARGNSRVGSLLRSCGLAPCRVAFPPGILLLHGNSWKSRHSLSGAFHPPNPWKSWKSPTEGVPLARNTRIPGILRFRAGNRGNSPPRFRLCQLA